MTNNDSPAIVTADHVTVTVGDRVFNYYDGEWGHIVSAPERDGWFDFQPEGTRERRLLNGERIAAQEPKR